MRRERRVFRRLFVQPFIFIAVISAPVLLIRQAEARERTSVFTVAVEGDVDAVPGLAAALDRAPFRLERSDDASRRLAAEAVPIGIVVPDDASQRVAAGDAVRLRVLVFSTQDVSERAGPALGRRIAELRRSESERRLREAGAPETLAAPLRIELADLATTSPEGLRFGLAQALPALLLVQLFGLIQVSEDRLAGAKDKRTLEALLVLPLRRRELLAGVGGAAAVVGALSALIVFIPLSVVSSTAIASIGRSLAGPLDLVVTLVCGAAGVAAVMTSLGLFIGARATSGTEGSTVLTIVQVAIFGLIAASPFFAEVDAAGPVLAVPVIGPLLYMREGVAAGPNAPATAVMLAGQLAVAAMLLRLAERSLGEERSVVRASGGHA